MADNGAKAAPKPPRQWRSWTKLTTTIVLTAIITLVVSELGPNVAIWVSEGTGYALSKTELNPGNVREERTEPVSESGFLVAEILTPDLGSNVVVNTTVTLRAGACTHHDVNWIFVEATNDGSAVLPIAEGYCWKAAIRGGGRAVLLWIPERRWWQVGPIHTPKSFP